MKTSEIVALLFIVMGGIFFFLARRGDGLGIFSKEKTSYVFFGFSALMILGAAIAFCMS